MKTTQACWSAVAHDSNPSHDSNPAPDSKTGSSRAQGENGARAHGIRSTDPVIHCHETLEDWLAHRDCVVRVLNPVGALETAYSQRAALYLWRLDRVIRFEITATQFDHDDVVAEFIIALDHPEIPRDRAEAATVEKVRKPLRDYLHDFRRSGAKAANLLEHQDGLARVRNEAKRVKERRLLPDPPTIQTIIKYEGHLQRCLAQTMAELRRLQKERRQALRRVEELDETSGEPGASEDQEFHAEGTQDRTAPCHQGEDDSNQTLDSIANRRPGDFDPNQTHDRTAPLPAVENMSISVSFIGMANLPVSRRTDIDQASDARRIASAYLSPKTYTDMKQAHQEVRSPEGEPHSQSSAEPSVIVRPGPMALETHIHQKE